MAVAFVNLIMATTNCPSSSMTRLASKEGLDGTTQDRRTRRKRTVDEGDYDGDGGGGGGGGDGNVKDGEGQACVSFSSEAVHRSALTRTNGQTLCSFTTSEMRTSPSESRATQLIAILSQRQAPGQLTIVLPASQPAICSLLQPKFWLVDPARPQTVSKRSGYGEQRWRTHVMSVTLHVRQRSSSALRCCLVSRRTLVVPREIIVST